MVLGALCVPTLISCDEHEPIDKDIHPGYILCADGSILSEDAYYSQSTTKACAVIFTEKTVSGHYLAVSVAGGGNGQFCDTLGVALGTSCSLSDIESEYIPSVQEMRELYGRIGLVNSVISRLSAHGDAVAPIATDEGSAGDCWYWTSTEVNENKGRQAWLFSLNSGGYIATPVVESHDYLSFVAIYY